MRELMLVVHFIGLTMGLGTGFGFLFLGIASSKMEKEKAKEFTINTFALSRMGKIGILLLLVSGGYLVRPYLGALSSQPFLIAKLMMVVVLITLLILQGQKSKQTTTGDFETQMKKVQLFGKIILLTAISIVIFAVLNFR